MTVLKSSRLLESLKAAKGVGILEEPVTIMGVEIIITNLSPEPFESAMDDLEGLSDAQYVHALQLSQLCRSVVSIDGVDLRECKFVETEIEDVDPETKQRRKRTVNVSKHEWIRENVLASWGREAIAVAWRKFMELMAKAEKESSKNVKFDSSLESSEDRFRRNLSDAHEVSQDLPQPLIEAILREYGYMLRTSKEELDEVDRRAREFAEEQQRLAEQETQSTPEPEPEPVSSKWTCGSCGHQNIDSSKFCGNCGGLNGPQPSPIFDPQKLMANRTPLNTAAVVTTSDPEEAAHMSSSRREQIAVEQGLMEQLNATGPDGRPVTGPVAEVRGAPPVAASRIAIDPKPSGGINPRFRPQIPPKRR